MDLAVSVMWCSNLTASARPREARMRSHTRIVSFVTEFEKLNPIRLDDPSGREKRRAVSSVHSTDHGLALPMNTEILNSQSTPILCRRQAASTVPGLTFR